MGLGARLKKFRNWRGMTMKYLGLSVGYRERGADTRISEFESENRKPNSEILDKISAVLNIAPEALSVPDIENYHQLMHTLFLMEDEYGITVDSDNCSIYLTVDPHHPNAINTIQHLEAWAKIRAELKSEKITKDDYDQWRYDFPASFAESCKQKIRSQK